MNNKHQYLAPSVYPLYPLPLTKVSSAQENISPPDHVFNTSPIAQLVILTVLRWLSSRSFPLDLVFGERYGVTLARLNLILLSLIDRFHLIVLRLCQLRHHVL